MHSDLEATHGSLIHEVPSNPLHDQRADPRREAELDSLESRILADNGAEPGPDDAGSSVVSALEPDHDEDAAGHPVMEHREVPL